MVLEGHFRISPSRVLDVLAGAGGRQAADPVLWPEPFPQEEHCLSGPCLVTHSAWGGGGGDGRASLSPLDTESSSEEISLQGGHR